jgi:hypothetical protein
MCANGVRSLARFGRRLRTYGERDVRLRADVRPFKVTLMLSAHWPHVLFGKNAPPDNGGAFHSAIASPQGPCPPKAKVVCSNHAGRSMISMT